MTETVDVYLEVGVKRVFAGALEWPGWCRIGADESSALQALLEYGPRYQAAVSSARLGFHAPKSGDAFAVRDRLDGGPTTDFGVTHEQPKFDQQPLDDGELKRLERLLRACWRTLDDAAERARGHELRKGPRGGGRNLEKVVTHVLEGDGGYLGSLGWKKPKPTGDLRADLEAMRAAVIEGLAASIDGDIPVKGPRGGTRWPARYFIRRCAWHTLDHAWEIEDRALP